MALLESSMCEVKPSTSPYLGKAHVRGLSLVQQQNIHRLRGNKSEGTLLLYLDTVPTGFEENRGIFIAESALKFSFMPGKVPFPGRNLHLLVAPNPTNVMNISKNEQYNISQGCSIRNTIDTTLLFHLSPQKCRHKCRFQFSDTKHLVKAFSQVLFLYCIMFQPSSSHLISTQQIQIPSYHSVYQGHAISTLNHSHNSILSALFTFQ